MRTAGSVGDSYQLLDALEGVLALDAELELRLLARALLIKEDSNANVCSGSLNLLCEQVQVVKVVCLPEVFKAFAPHIAIVDKTLPGFPFCIVVLVVEVSELSTKGNILRLDSLLILANAYVCLPVGSDDVDSHDRGTFR